MSATTTAPIIAGTSADAEFMDAKGIQAHFGLKPGLLYSLWHAGHVRTICVRKPGKERGKRLFVVQSVRDYLNSEACADRIEAGEYPKEAK